MLTIRNLTCNQQTAPLGMDDLHPVFSWQLDSRDRLQLQRAYRLIVATTAESLRQDQGDLWDTGRVESDASIQVRYGGKELASRQGAYWKVKAWDQDDLESDWSEPAYFEMGLLRPEDWAGQWIGHPDSSWEAIRPAPYLRKNFLLDQPVRKARIYLCGLGYYELYLNGRRVGDHVLDPAFTRYDKRVLYVTYDVTELLQPGENVASVILGNGFFNQAARDAWYFEKSPWRASPRLLFQAEIWREGLPDPLQILSDAEWKAGNGPICFDATRLGEMYDARLEIPGWNEVGFDDSGWLPARIVEGPRGNLSAQSQPPSRVTQSIRPVKLWKTPAGNVVFDMGQNFAGWARLRASGAAGTEITLRYGELLAADGALDQSNIRWLVYEGEAQVDRYILKGEGEEAYEPRFTYHGFQYVELQGYPGEPTLDSIEGRVVQTDFGRAGSFTCSDPLINRLQRMTEWSYISNFTAGYPTDCPQREKNGWTGDAHLAAETGLYNFHADTAYMKWMNDLADEQRDDGALPGIVPTSGWGYEWGNGPCWDSACVLIPWYLYLYRGSRAALEAAYPMMRRYLEYLGAKSGGGNLVSLGLGDWVPPYGHPEDYTAPLTLLASAYFFMDLEITSRAAVLLGFTEDAARYAGWAEKVRRQFNALFYDPVSGLYAGGSQTALSMALYAGLVAPDERPRVARQLVAEIRQQKGRINTGIHGAKAVLHALAENGFHALALHLVTQPRYPGWAWWIDQGATTLWETWDGKSSRNHIMFGDISAYFYKYLAGIRPDPEQPGFKHIIFRPVPIDGMTWVRAEHESPYGTIRSAWEREQGVGAGRGFSLVVSLPANTRGLVYLPKCRADSVLVNGQTPAAAGSQPVFQRTGGAVLPVGSGEWTFNCDLT